MENVLIIYRSTQYLGLNVKQNNIIAHFRRLYAFLMELLWMLMWQRAPRQSITLNRKRLNCKSKRVLQFIKILHGENGLSGTYNILNMLFIPFCLKRGRK